MTWARAGRAIDLTMMVEQTDYKGAVNWLAREFGTGAVLEQTVAVAKRAVEVAAKAPPQPYKAPEPSPENWPRVRHYLTEVRRLSAGLVDRVHELGKLYADRYANAVFVLGKGEGVELRGTGEAVSRRPRRQEALHHGRPRRTQGGLRGVGHRRHEPV